MASHTTTASALPYPDRNDGFGVAGDMEQLAKALDTKVVMAFASAADRSLMVPTPQDGALCYLRDAGRYEIFNGGRGEWSWPRWAQGELARANFTDTNTNPPQPGRTPLALQPTGLPAFAVSVPSLPNGRKLRITFSGVAVADSPTTYGFVCVFAGVERRGMVQMMQPGVPVSFHISYVITTQTAFQLATGGIPAAAIIAGNGGVYLQSTGLDGPTQFVVEDIGGV